MRYLLLLFMSSVSLAEPSPHIIDISSENIDDPEFNIKKRLKKVTDEDLSSNPVINRLAQAAKTIHKNESIYTNESNGLYLKLLNSSSTRKKVVLVSPSIFGRVFLLTSEDKIKYFQTGYFALFEHRPNSSIIPNIPISLGPLEEVTILLNPPLSGKMPLRKSENYSYVGAGQEIRNASLFQ